MGIIFNTFWSHDWQPRLVHSAPGRAKPHNACPIHLGSSSPNPCTPCSLPAEGPGDKRRNRVQSRASQGSWREASKASWSGFGVNRGAGWSRGSEEVRGVDRTEGRDKESQEFNGGTRGDRTPQALWRQHTGEKQVRRKVRMPCIEQNTNWNKWNSLTEYCDIHTPLTVVKNSTITSIVTPCLCELKFTVFIFSMFFFFFFLLASQDIFLLSV